MRNFRKRTIALCIASAITVLGSFATEAYPNSIVSLRIDSGSYGVVKLTAFTKKPYAQTIRTEKVDDNKYYIILPGTKSEITAMPMINQFENIESMQVATFPAVTGKEGYTCITINTKDAPSVSAVTSLYIPDKNGTNIAQIPEIETLTQETEQTEQTPKKITQQSYWNQHTDNTEQTKESQVSRKKTKSTEKKPETSHIQENTQKEDYNIYNDMPNNSSNERMPILIGFIVVSILVLLIFLLNKDKMASIVGDQKEFDFEDKDESQKTKSKIKNIRKTINKLDNTYKNVNPLTEKVNIITGQRITKEAPEINTEYKNEPVQEDVVVDLDSLYNEKTKTEQNNNTDESALTTSEVDDLAGFLNEFSFDEEAETQEEFDEELYENTINNNNLNFSNNDSKKLNQLLQNEISDDTLYNIENFAPQTPKPKHVPSEIEILENVIAEYTIKQNISFSKDDVDTMRKLINVELDRDFITDLRTNPKRTEEMKKEIEEKEKKPHKSSEMLILNVKDMLPDLSKEVKKHGNKKIESKAKPEVIYYSEGYEVSKLSVTSDLANISKAVHDKNSNKFRPSDELPIVDNNYEVQTLSIKDQLPDIADYNVNPLKYENHKKADKVDEKALLNSIANVQFKPFYEDVQKEFRQFDGFEIINNEEEDKKADEQALIELENYNKSVKQSKPKQTQKTNDDAQKLLELISEQQAERQNKKQNESKDNTQNDNATTEQKQENIKEAAPKICVIDGVKYNILKSISCDDCLNCYLAKNNSGYAVISRINDTYKLLKQYDELRTENIQTRIRETLPDGTKQYIARVSIHKFIFNVYKENMEFVMDLC